MFVVCVRYLFVVLNVCVWFCLSCCAWFVDLAWFVLLVDYRLCWFFI